MILIQVRQTLHPLLLIDYELKTEFFAILH